jgi:hypothetical protein
LGESTREKVKAEILKLPKPEELKRFIVIDIWEDICRKIMNLGKSVLGGRKRGKLRLLKVEVPKWI